jgi:beta-glucuronidase
MGRCLNLTNATNTPTYPEGSQYDFRYEQLGGPHAPSKWPNPGDVEFLYTGCDAINCWVEPRCTVESVNGDLVSLQQGDNSSCYHRLYYWAACFTNFKGPGRKPRNPTSLENVATNFSFPGQFYYDRAAASISYIPREGETLAQIEATATTATQQTLLVVNGTSNLRWEGVSFQFATWLGASGPKGYIDTQSAYLCMDGEPPANVELWNATNVTFSGCDFRHLGAVYALTAHNASQDTVVSNCTFTDCSGGGVKLGNVGERGAPPPRPDLEPRLQDRGYLVSDNLFTNMPLEYSGR